MNKPRLSNRHIRVLVRVMNGADEVGLTALSKSVRGGLFAVAHGRYDDARERLKEAAGYADIAKRVSVDKAQLFAPGAKFHLAYILSKIT